jgi:phenol hydroxylase P1 protein
MQVDIKTTSVPQLRETFSHIARRLGGDKPASRYQEATFDLQPTTNFHYRPLWGPELELYDVRRTRIVMKDWYSLRDPRQYYYGTYTIARSRQQDGMERSIDFVDKRGLLRDLPNAVREQLIFALVPLRHVEWGANTHNCYVTAYAWGTAVTQAAMFHTMDRLGIAQYISRIGLLLDGNSGSSLEHGRELWLHHPAWQPLRRLVERMLVTRDWFEVFVAQNLVLDSLLHPLVFRQFERRMSSQHGPALSLVSEFMRTWFDESSRWVDATISGAASDSTDNAELLSRWVTGWLEAATAAVQPYTEQLFETDAAEVLKGVQADLDKRAAKLGLVIARSAS